MAAPANVIATSMPPSIGRWNPPATTTRRQNHSCDRCRHGKRACDATISGNNRVECSNCARMGRECTFQWLQSSRSLALKLKDGQKANERQRSPINEEAETNSVVPRHEWTVSRNGSNGSWKLPAFSHDSASSSSTECWNLQPRVKGTQSTSQNCLELPYYFYSNAIPPAALAVDELLTQPPEEDSTVTDSIELPTLNHSGDGVGECIQTHSEFDGPASKRRCVPLNRRRRQSSSVSRVRTYQESMSPWLASGIHQRTNRHMISESLLQIYRDSMENALSCWLTEKTCPYETESVARNPPFPQGFVNLGTGSNPSALISTRVCGLDQAFDALRNHPLTPAEQRRASQALDAVIMAFASQWSHVFDRSNPTQVNGNDSSYSFHSASDDQSCDLGYSKSSQADDGTATGTHFDRRLQEQLWHNAQRLLQEASGVDSFKVSFAHIIFAFTQRPLDLQKHSKELEARSSVSFHASTLRPDSPASLKSSMDSSGESMYTTSKYTASNSADLEELISLEGPPVALETALRQLFVWRNKLENPSWTKSNQSNRSARERLTGAEMQTFNFLFWLGVMLETLSAAMNQRPLVVSDGDSVVLRQSVTESESSRFAPKSPSLDFPNTSDTNESPWGTMFLRPNKRESPPNMRWPCSYEDASAALHNAAPVKVLLFRKVTRIQTLEYRHAGAEKLEDAIQDALSVYEHWNSTYGLMMLDFVAHHEELHPRLQSWYVVLTGHWHLAVFLLADTIEKIDMHGRSLSTRRLLRGSADLLRHIREQSAFEIAEVARVSSPNKESSFYRTSNFHDHVNQGALLTEPWTDVLIRSFGKACCLFLDWLDLCRTDCRMPDQPSAASLYGSCADCITGLEELGRKSDMANLVAMTFAPRLQRLGRLCGVWGHNG